LSAIISVTAWLRGASYVTLACTIVYIAAGVVLGSILMLGNIFDMPGKRPCFLLHLSYRLLARTLAHPQIRDYDCFFRLENK
jgi:hypothetical protein